MLTPTKNGFITADGTHKRYVELHAEEPLDTEWIERQEASINEYQDHTTVIPAEVQTLYALFDGFISTCLAGRRDQLILDVGCGIRSDWPIYATSLKAGQIISGNTYIGLDPLSFNLQDREYPFIAGRLEDVPGKLSKPIDVFLFSTSLDHFQDLEAVAHVVSDLASSSALCIFWVGLHNQTRVAEQAGAHVFRKLYSSLHPLRFIFQYTKTSISVISQYFRLLRRRSLMLAGKPLDDLHFHYFTEQNLPAAMALFGKIERYLHVPGTNSVFVCVRRGE